MQSNEKIIQDFAEARMLKALAMFHMLKKKQTHSIIFHCTPKIVADYTGISEKTAKKYINFILRYRYKEGKEGEKKIAYMNKDMLFLNKIEPKKHLCTIKFKETDSLEYIETLLYEKIIDYHKKKQLYYIRKKAEDQRLYENPKNLAEVKKRNKILKSAWMIHGKKPGDQGRLVIPTSYDIITGVSYLSKRLHVSRRKMIKILGILKKTDRITVTKRIIKVARCKYSMFRKNKDLFQDEYGYCWWYHGIVYHNQTNLISSLYKL